MKRSIQLAVLTISLACAALFAALPKASANGAAAQLTAAPVDFQCVVRPILSNNCFHCHGPDKSTRLAGLRLDTREGAFAARKNGTPVVPGNPRASLLYQCIPHANAARLMPPEDSHKTLTSPPNSSRLPPCRTTSPHSRKGRCRLARGRFHAAGGASGAQYRGRGAMVRVRQAR